MNNNQPRIIEERVAFMRGGLRLSGTLTYPATGEPGRLVLLCTPHPNFAGDMDNNVIAALGRGLAATAITLRFDYHGVGTSQINLPQGLSVFDYWQQIEDSRDYAPAVTDVAAAARYLESLAAGLPLDIVGYSFGAATGLRHGLSDQAVHRLAAISPPLSRVDFTFMDACPKPCLLLAGDNDFVCPEAAMQALASRGGLRVKMTVLAGEDHFHRGSEAAVLDHVAAFLNLPIAASADPE